MLGEPKKGKTFIALSMAEAIALGKPWAGQEVARGLAVYFAGEGGFGVEQRALAVTGGRPPSEMPLALIPSRFNMMTVEGVDEILRKIEACAKIAGLDPLAAFLDTVSRGFVGENENEAGPMGKFVAAVDRIREKTGAAVIPLHHMSKANEGVKGAEAKRGRGHSLLRGAYDTALLVEKGKVSVIEQRDLEKSQPMTFKFRTEMVGPDVNGKMVKTAVAAVSPPRISTEEAFGDEGGVQEHLNPAFDAFCAVAKTKADGVVSVSEWFDRIDADAKEAGRNKPVRSTKNAHKDALANGDFIVSGDKGLWRLK
jgi:hypothetical protein